MSEGHGLCSTLFAPAERAGAETLEAQHGRIGAEAGVREMLEAFPDPAVILNRERQIVAAKGRMERLAGRTAAGLLGSRVGEALSCEHAHDLPNGCGTTRFCRNCGSAKVMVRHAATGVVTTDECRIVRREAGEFSALDLRVWASALEVRGERFMVFAVRDTSDEKRRAMLERMFFHDVLNAAGGLRGLIGLLPELEDDERAELEDVALRLSEQIVEEIEAQRDLAAAERGDLETEMREIDAVKVLEHVAAVFARHALGAGRQIRVDVGEGATTIVSDEVLLRRVLGNLVKNAIEASAPDEAIGLSLRSDGAPQFRVHNAAGMSDAVRDQIFQRSFSTKLGPGRGIGTYSIRLLTERYLGGTVSFTTSEEDGTTFTISLPGRLPPG